MPAAIRKRLLSKKPFIYLTLALSLLIVVGGVFFYRYQLNQIRTDKYNELKTIAELKTDQITTWMKERRGDAITISGSPFFMRAVADWMANPDSGDLYQQLKRRLEIVCRYYGYADVLLYSIKGKCLIAAVAPRTRIDQVTHAKILEAARTRTLHFSDFYLCETHQRVHLDFVVPVLNKDGQPIAVLILRMAPESFLYPLINKWPVPYQNAETMLLRREGDSLVVLNALRHQPTSALHLRLPLSNRGLASVEAVLGKTGIFEGRDYRDVDVVAHLDSVPGTPWYIVVKDDRSELFGELYLRMHLIFISIFLLLIGVGAAMALIYNNRQRGIYRALYLDEKEVHAMETQFRTMLYSIGDAVIITDKEGLVQMMNPVAESLTGWSEVSAQGKSIETVFRIINENNRQKVENPINRVIREGLVVGLANHTLLITQDGREIPIADSGAPIKAEKGEITGVVLVFRDQTAERAAQKALQESEEKYRLIVDNAYDGIEITQNDRIYFCNARFAEMLGYTVEEIKKLPFSSFYTEAGLVALEERRIKLETGSPLSRHFETNFVRKDGTIIDVEIIYEIIDFRGAPATFAIVRDITDRKRHDELLMNERRLLRTVIDNLPDNIYVKDTAARKILANRGDLAFIGKSESEVLGKTDLEIYPPEEADRCHADDLQVLKTGNPVLNREEVLRNAQGEERWLLTSKVPILDHQGKITGLVGIGHDITENRQARQTLQESEDKYRALFDQAVDAIFLHDLEGRILEVNQVACLQSGYTREELLHMNVFDLHPQTEAAKNLPRAEILRHWKQWQPGQRSMWDGEHQCKDGTILQVQISTGLINYGAKNAILAIVRDITEHKQAEQKIIELTERQKAILSSVPDIIMEVDTQKVYTWANHAGIEFFGEDVIGRKADFYFEGEQATYKIVQPLFNGGEDVIYVESWQRRKDGEKRLLAWWCRVLKDAQGNVSGALSTARDITQQVKADDQIRFQANLLTHVSDAIIATDNEGFIQTWNPAAEKTYGWPAQEAVGKKYHDILKPEYRYESREKVYAELTQNGIWSGKIIHHHRDGHHLLMLSTISTIKNAEDEKIGLVSINHDVTEQTRVEEALETAVKSAHVGLWDEDFRTGKITRNAEWAEMLGYKPEEIADNINAFYDLLHPDDLAFTQAKIKQQDKNSADFMQIEHRLRAKDGSYKWILNLGRITEHDTEGKPLRASGVHLDITERKVAELALQESEARYRFLTENMADIIWTLDLDLRTTFVSSSIEKVLGFTPEERKSQPVETMMPPETLQNLRSMLKQELLNEQSGHYDPDRTLNLEFQYYHKDGHLLWFDNALKWLRDAQGHIIGIYGVSRDITQRKQVEQELHDSEQLFRNLFEKHSAVKLLIDPDTGQIIDANNAAVSFYGWSREELENMRIQDINTLPEDEVKQEMEKVRRGQRVHFEFRHRRADGSVRDVEVFSSKIEFKGKDLLHSVIHDITDRKSAETKLLDSEETYRNLFQNAQVGLFRTRISDGKILESNDQLAEMFGYHNREDFIAEYFTANNYVDPGTREVMLAEIKQKGFIRNFEARFYRKDRSIFWAKYSARVFPEKGWIEGVAEDITERKRMEAALKESEEHLRQTQKLEALGQLASGIAHDFNNILAIIIGHATLLKQGKQPPDRITHSLDTIEKTSQRGADLVKQLLTLSRKAEPVTAPINFGEIVNEVVHLLAETFPKTIEVETDLDAEPLIVMADASQINQVLMNLCLNARDAMPQGGRLRVTAHRVTGQQVRRHHADAGGDAYAELRVTDTGIGMDKATLERIFEPFYTTKELGRGTGLGLTTVHSIIRNHNGLISVESQPGKGTTFIIYLPLPASLSATKPTISAEMPVFERGHETILLIEDEESIVELMTAVLDSQGYKVIVATDGLMGVEEYGKASSKIDLVISDMGLPKLNGDEVFRRIRKINPQAKIILASGFLDPAQKSELYKVGLAQFIQKPYLPTEALKIIREVLDRAA